MKDCTMYSLNLSRLLDACPFITDNALYIGLYEYCIENEVDLNCINLDDWVVNGITFLDKEEYDSMSDEEKEDMWIIAEADEGYWII